MLFLKPYNALRASTLLRSTALASRTHGLCTTGARRPYSGAKDELVDASNEIIINEDKLGLETAQTSGAPAELMDRTVQIYKMSPAATQSGRRQQKGWRINWDVIGRANRWEDTTIGYAASGDYMQATEMHFHTKEDAIRFARNQGWNYYVREPKQRTFRPKSYGDNFVHHPDTLKMIFTK